MEIGATNSSFSFSQVGLNQSANKTERTQTEEIRVAQEEAEQKSDKSKDTQELMKLQEDLNKELNPLNIEAEFNYNDKTEELYVSVYEKDSKKLLRKIPSDEAMRLMEKMREIIGTLFDKNA